MHIYIYVCIHTYIYSRGLLSIYSYIGLTKICIFTYIYVHQT